MHFENEFVEFIKLGMIRKKMEKIIFFILWIVFIVNSNVYPSDENPQFTNGIFYIDCF